MTDGLMKPWSRNSIGLVLCFATQVILVMSVTSTGQLCVHTFEKIFARFRCM